MIKVRIKDFQSIRAAELEIEGLTVITGSNDTGKSAVRRAIMGVFNNTPGSAFVHKGQAKCEVSIEFDDGHTVKWEKGQKVKPTYTIDGGAPLHPGRGVPAEALAFGVNPIRAGNQDLWPQFSPQIKGVVFLLDKSGAVIAEAVADVERVGVLNDAMRLAEKDLRTARSTLKIRRKDAVDLEAELATYEGLDDVVAGIEALGKEKAELDKLARRVVALDRLRSRYQAASAQIEALAEVEEIEIPGSQHIDDTIRDLRALVSFRRRLRKAHEAVAHYGAFGGVSIPSEGDIGKVAKAIEVLQGLQGRMRKSLRDVIQLRLAWEGAQEEYAAAQDEVDLLLAHIPECPTCGAVTEEGDHAPH